MANIYLSEDKKMNVFYRAFITIKMNLIKSILLSSVFFVLSLTVITLIVAVSSINITTDIIENSIPIVTTARRIRHTQNNLNTNLIKEISELQNVTIYNFSIPFRAYSILQNFVPDSNYESFYSFDIEGINSFFWLNGVSHVELINSESGIFSLVEGRFFSEHEINNIDFKSPTPILISSEVAYLNNIGVGSILNLYNDLLTLPPEITFEVYQGLTFEEKNILYWENITLKPHAVEVVGLLELDLNNHTDFENLTVQQVIYNSIFVPNWFSENLYSDFIESHRFSHKLAYLESGWIYQTVINPFWTIENINSLDQFIIDANEILPDGFEIDHQSHIFLPLLNAMHQVSLIVNQFIVFVLLAAIIVLILVLLLFFKDRRNEIGIYLALGEHKRSIISQLTSEILFISIFAIILSIPFANIISRQITNELVFSELTREYQELNEEQWIFSEELGRMVLNDTMPSQLEFSGINRDLTINELHDLFSVSFTPLAIIFSIGFIAIVITISSIVPILYLLEQEPKKLLLQGKIG